MEKVQNLLSFSDFEKNWNPKSPKKTKRTDVGLDIIEEKFIDDNEIIDDEDVDIDDEDVEDVDIDDGDVDIDDDDSEDSDWKEELLSLINQIIEDGTDPDDVYEYLDDLADEYESEDENEEEGIEVEGEEETVDEEEVADDDEGEEIGESIKNFKKWNKK
jgi:hypothetical protein